MGIYSKSEHIQYVDPVPTLGITNIYPRLSGILTALDRNTLAYLVGELKVEGPGKVKMVCPEVSELKDYILLPNVCYNFFPIAIAEAVPNEGASFKGWKLGDTGEVVSNERLYFTRLAFPNILVFTACFE